MKYNQPYGISDPNGPYINGNPATGQQGSIPPAESIEYPQREIANLITDAGITPSNSDLRQLGKAIQSQLLWSDDDVGTINALQVTQAPAPTAYVKYMVVVAKIANDNTGPSTLNVNAMGAKAIKHVNGTDLAASELKQNSICCFVYDGTNFQLAWSSAGLPGAGPVYLTAAKTYYVNASTGSDSFDGTSATVTGGNKGPFATLQRAANEVVKYNMNGFNLTVLVAAGSYAGVNFSMPTGAGTLVIQGSGQASCFVNGVNDTAFSIYGYGSANISGFKVTTTGAQAGDPLAGIFTGYVTLDIHDMEFGQCTGPHMCITRSSNCTLYGNITISGSSTGTGSSPAHITCFYNALIASAPTLAALNYVVTTTVNLGTFVDCSQFGAINLTWTSFSGAASVNATRYVARLNGVINSGGGGASYYPGNVAGSTATGGQYA